MNKFVNKNFIYFGFGSLYLYTSYINFKQNKQNKIILHDLDNIDYKVSKIHSEIFKINYNDPYN